MSSTHFETEYVWDINNERGYRNAMGRYKTGMEMAFVTKHLGSKVEILDLGGGSGRFALPLTDAGHTVTVVDLSREATNLLRQRNESIGVLCGDFCALDLGQKFDAVIAIESVPFFTNLAFSELFSRVKNILRPHGVFIFTALNSQSWRYQLHTLRRKRRSYNVANPTGYKTALNQAGFSVAEIQGFVWMPLPVDSNSPLVPLFAATERRVGLGRWIGQSPWLLIAAQGAS